LARRFVLIQKVMETKIDEIEFVPLKANKGLFGFVSFVLNGELFCGSIAVYSRIDGSGTGIRLVYPKINSKGHQFPTFYPIKKELASKIEEKVAEKVKEIFNGLSTTK